MDEARFKTQYAEALDALHFSDEAKERMTRGLARAAEAMDAYEESRPALRVVDGGSAMNTKHGTIDAGESNWKGASAGTTARRRTGGRRRARTAAAVAAAAVATLGIASAVYAGGNLAGVGNLVDDLFNGAPAKTEVVEKIGRPLGASTTNAGITVTADSIVGDGRNYAVVYNVERDDGAPFEGLGTVGDGKLNLTFGYDDVLVDGVLGSGGGCWFYDADPHDNAIQYVQQINVYDTTAGKSIIGKTMRVDLRDLQTFNDDGTCTTVADGRWKLKFRLDFEDTTVALPAGQRMEVGGKPAVIDEASVSAIALALRYTVDAVDEVDPEAAFEDLWGSVAGQPAAEGLPDLDTALLDGMDLQTVMGTMAADGSDHYREISMATDEDGRTGIVATWTDDEGAVHLAGVSYGADAQRIEAGRDSDLLDLGVVTLTMADGSAFEVDANNGGSVSPVVDGRATCSVNVQFDRILDVAEIFSVEAGGAVIPVNERG